MRPLIECFKKDENVSFAFVFGSYVKGKQRADSDLDLAVYFKKPLTGIELLFFINKLSELTGKEIDVVVLNNASAFLRHQVMKNGKPLFIKDSVVYRHFREKTMTDYEEYKFVSGMYAYD